MLKQEILSFLQCGEPHEELRALVHFLEGGVFEPAVEIIPAGA